MLKKIIATRAIGSNHHFSRVTTAVLLLVFARSAAAVPVSYTANMHTSNGQPVTNIMILESDGAQTNLDYSFTVPGTGISVLTHDVPFSPTKSLVIGLTEGVDKTQIVMLLNNDFAQNNAGVNFSVAFPHTRHSELITRLTEAEAGNASQLAWFSDTFFPGDGAAAAFDTGGAFRVAEFTILTVIGASATAGNWQIDGTQNISEGGLGAESGRATSIIDETATDAGPFDIEFQLSEQGVIAIDKSVLNDSGAPWTDFELILGTGLGSAFIPSTAGDLLAFVDTFPNREDTGAFPNLVFDEDRLLFSGFLADGDTANFVAFVNSGIGTVFTLRQIPTLVPEPSTIALTLVGLSCVNLARRKRR